MPRTKSKFMNEASAKAAAVQLEKQHKDKNKFLAPSEISELLGVTSEAIKQWIYTRRLPAIKLTNGYWKVKVADLAAYLKSKYDIQRRILIFSEPAGLPQFPPNAQIILTASYADAVIKAAFVMPSILIADEGLEDSWKLIKKLRETKMTRNVPVIFFSRTGFAKMDVDKAVEMRIQSVVELSALTAEIQKALN